MQIASLVIARGSFTPLTYCREPAYKSMCLFAMIRRSYQHLSLHYITCLYGLTPNTLLCCAPRALEQILWLDFRHPPHDEKLADGWVWTRLNRRALAEILSLNTIFPKGTGALVLVSSLPSLSDLADFKVLQGSTRLLRRHLRVMNFRSKPPTLPTTNPSVDSLNF